MKGFCNVSVAPLRGENRDSAEMVSQILYGEEVEILEVRDNWTFVRMLYDGYEGWMDTKQITKISENLQSERKVSWITEAFLQVDSLGMLLSLGSEVEFSTEALPQKSRESIVQLAKSFLNVPYLWGGRSYFGIDCSGFTQVIFKVHGIRIPRDSSKQALEGTDVSFVEAAQPGDLAFFGKFNSDEAEEEVKITHVGIMLNNSEIIHAHGKVRIDKIDATGIFNVDENRHTHRLRFIKSFIS